MIDDMHTGTCWRALFLGRQYADVQQRFEPLKALVPPAPRVVNFGCWQPTDDPTDIRCGNEPYALLWTLRAIEVVVVDAKAQYIENARLRYQWVASQVPSCFQAGSIEFLQADMTGAIPGLKPSYFDLSYCEHVLRGIFQEHGVCGLRTAIGLMARVLRRGGLGVACELPRSLPPCTPDLFADAGFAPESPVQLGQLREQAYVFRKL